MLPGRWTFQIVEEYDDTYWSVFRELERRARDQLAGVDGTCTRHGSSRASERSGTVPTRPPLITAVASAETSG